MAQELRHLPPNGEALKNTAERTPFFERCIMGDLREGKSVLVVAHGNSNRSIVMDLEKMTGAILALVRYRYSSGSMSSTRKEVVSVGSGNNCAELLSGHSRNGGMGFLAGSVEKPSVDPEPA